MTVGELVVRFGADLAPLQKGMKDMQRSLEPIQKRLTSLGTAMSKFVTGPILAAGAAATGAAVQLGNYASSLSSTAAATGLSTDTLQEFEHIARNAGTEAGALSGAAEGLTRRLRATGDESEGVAASIAMLGVSIRDAGGNIRSMDELMPELIGGLSRIENVTERNALAMRIFGRRASLLAPVLDMGSEAVERYAREAHELGLVLDSDALESADRFRIQIQNLGAEMKAVGREITGAFLPVIEGFVGAMREHAVPVLRSVADHVRSLIGWWQELNPVIQRAALVVTGLAVALGPVLVALGGMLKVLPVVAAGFGLITSPITLTIAALTALGAAAWYVVDNWDALVEDWRYTFEQYKLISLAALSSIASGFESFFRFIKPEIADAARVAQAGLQGMMQGIDLTKPRQEFKSLGDYVRRASGEVKDLIGAAVPDIDVPGVSGGSGIGGAADSIQRMGEVSRVAGAGLEVLAGGLEVARVRTDELREANDQVAEGMTRMQQLGLHIGEMFADHFAYGIGRVVEGVIMLEDGFKSMTDIVQSFGAMMQRVLARVIADITATIAKAVALKGVLSVLGLGSGLSIGGIFMDLAGIGRRAMGGPVMGHVPYLVGERGPELFVPPTGGRIVPNHALTAAGPEKLRILQPMVGIRRGELIAWIDEGRRVAKY